MTGWTSDRIRDVAASWVWVPPLASEARTPEYHLVAYPDSEVVPTQVVSCRSERPAAAVVEEVLAVARAWGRRDVSFWVDEQTAPDDLADHLRSRGATHVESVELLSLPLTPTALRAAGLEAVERDGALVCAGVEARQVRDAATLRDSDLVSTEVWGGAPPEEVEHRLAELTAPGASELRVVAYVDGEPAAAAGCTVADEVARLWGGATREAHRGRGAYKATLAARLRLAHDRGATLGLVRAVTHTSAPILHRLGFTGHGFSHRLRLAVAPPEILGLG